MGYIAMSNIRGGQANGLYGVHSPQPQVPSTRHGSAQHAPPPPHACRRTVGFVSVAKSARSHTAVPNGW